jgi:intracellular multiplication protein IcmP
METIDPVSVTFNQMLEVTTLVGEYTRYPVMAILIGLASLLYFSNVTLKFRKTYSMTTLRSQEKANWQQIIPVAKLDIAKESIDKGPWAMAQTPMDFAKAYNLLRKDDFAPDDPLKPGTPVTAGIRRGESKSVFTLQLGAVWEGFELLPIHYLALAAVFAARINQDRDGASKMLLTINESIATGKISFMGAKSLIKKHINSPIVRECEQRHAYNITVLATLIEAARDDGVLPCCDFLWLKTYDRRLWYMLSSVGRQTPFVEVGGVFAHWKAEKALGRRSIVPMIDEAVKALELAVKEVKLSLKEMGELKP